jgi:putative DNA primase/helicase
MTAAEIAAACGNARREGRGWRCRCPVHGGHSLVLADGRNALLVKCWAGCDARDVLAKVRRLGLTSGDCRTADATDGRLDDRRDRAQRIEFARRIWTAARDVRATPVERCLADRGINTPLPPSLRYAPRCRHPSGIYLPAMVARVEGLDGDLIAVHRTYLEHDASGVWHRRDRASLGSVGGGAVRLAPAAETLLVTEGIETALAAMQATMQATWAALSTSGIVALVLPSMVRTVVICADNDENGAGQRAARAAAQRWLAEGRRVRIAMPSQPGRDMADVLLAGRPRLVGGRDAA